MATSGTNEELLRKGFRAFSERRYEDCLETMHPDVEWHIAFRLPDLPPHRSVVHGHDAVQEVWRQFGAVWDTLVFHPEKILYDSAETAIVRVHVQGVGRESQIEVDRTLYYVMTIRDRLLQRLVPFDSPGEAAEAAGVDPAELSAGL
jgi:ketosteroid isomerase-like protein